MWEFIYPRHCPVCDEVVRIRDGLCCKECRDIFVKVKPPFCMKCGKHVEEEIGLFCFDCSRKPHYFEKGMALYEYKSVHDSVYMFKNRGRCEYADYYAEVLCADFAEQIREMEADALIPIPLDDAKMRKRGYNQAGLLANAMSKLCKIPVRDGVLLRNRQKMSQKHLDDMTRQNNVKKAFHIKENDVKLKNIILIDDVYTTGSTMDAAAQIFREHGAEKVYFLTLAIGKGK